MPLPRIVLYNACSSRGADMGRPSRLPPDVSLPIKLRLVKLKWVDCDYDQGGAYWGNSHNGEHIYWAETVEEHEINTGYGEPFSSKVMIAARAKSREEAKEIIRESLPNATFYR